MPLLRLSTFATLAVLAVAPAQADAQGQGTPAKEEPAQRPLATDSSVSIPRNMVPPAGKCRIWMRGVPAAQQPAPTDCTTALRQSPANGVLVFGPALRDLSPFDVRNPWSATSSEVTRERASGRRDSSARSRPAQETANTTGVESSTATRSAPAVREATPTTKRAPTVREASPATRTAPAVRETTPRSDPPPPPPPPKKKPE